MAMIPGYRTVGGLAIMQTVASAAVVSLSVAAAAVYLRTMVRGAVARFGIIPER